MRATSVRINEEVLDRLDRLGKSLNRPRSWMIAKAIERYLEYEEWFVEGVEEGIRAAEEGKVVEHQDVREWVESWETPDERKRPSCGG